MSTPKPWDIPLKLTVKGITVNGATRNGDSSYYLLSALFSDTISSLNPNYLPHDDEIEYPIGEPVSRLSPSTLALPLYWEYAGEKEGDYPLTVYPKFKYSVSDIGNLIGYQGDMSFIHLLGNIDGHHFSDDFSGVSYQGKQYGVELTHHSQVEDATVIDGMLLTMSHDIGNNIVYVTYVDTEDNEAVAHDLFSLELGVVAGNATGGLLFTNNATETATTTNGFIPNTPVDTLNYSSEVFAYPASARVDILNKKFCVFCSVTLRRGDESGGIINEKEKFFGVVDTEISFSIATGEDGVRGIAIEDPVYTEYKDETLGVKQTIDSNIQCSGREHTLVRKEINVYGWDASDPPEWVVTGTEWVDSSDTGIKDGDALEEDTLTQVAYSIAEFDGSVSMKYELYGSQKVCYAFIGGVKTFVTAKAVTGNESSTYTANVALKRPKVHINNTDPVAWVSFEQSSTTTDYRTSNDAYVNSITELNAALGLIDDETWELLENTENMAVGLYYEDGTYLEGVAEGDNTVIGGNFNYKYTSSGFGFKEFDGLEPTETPATTQQYHTKVTADIVSRVITGGDRRMPQSPELFRPGCAFYKPDDKFAAIYAMYGGNYYGGTAQPLVTSNATDQTLWNATETATGALLGYDYFAPTITSVVDSLGVGADHVMMLTTSCADVSAEITGRHMENFDISVVDTDSIAAKPVSISISENAVIEPGASTHVADQVNNTWTTLADVWSGWSATSYGGVFPSSWLLTAVPNTGYYFLVGSPPTGIAQWSTDPVPVLTLVYSDIGEAVSPTIAPIKGSRVYIANNTSGIALGKENYDYRYNGDSWVFLDKPDNATPDYTSAELTKAEQNGGLVGKSVYDITGRFTFNPTGFGKASMFRVQIPGSDNFMYSASVYISDKYIDYGDAGFDDNDRYVTMFEGGKKGGVIHKVESLPYQWKRYVYQDPDQWYQYPVHWFYTGYGNDTEEIVLGIIE